MIKKILLIGLSFLGVIASSVYAAPSVICEEYFSTYDCVYQLTEDGAVDPEGDCSVCSGYDAEFTVDTGSCTFSEYNQIAESVAVLYANQPVQQQHLLAMQQCKALSTTGAVAECFDDCSDVTTGDALSACMSICVYDDGFGARLDFIPRENQCSPLENTCTQPCNTLGYLADHCEEVCRITCNYDAYQGGGSLHMRGYCGDGLVANGEACDDGNNINGDGCDYNCHLEPGYGWGGSGLFEYTNDNTDNGDDDQTTSDDSGSANQDELLDTGSEPDEYSAVEQLVAHDGEDGLFPSENQDPEELPKAGAWMLDTITSKIFLLIALVSMSILMVVANRQQ